MDFPCATASLIKMSTMAAIANLNSSIPFSTNHPRAEPMNVSASATSLRSAVSTVDASLR